VNISSIRDFLLHRFHPRRRAFRMRCTQLRDESGSALIELAFTLSLVGIPLLLCTVHFSTLLIDSISVANAAHAGAEYGMQSSTNAADGSDGIQTAATEDASGLGTTLTVTPTTFYVCSTAIAGTQYTTAALAATPCTSSHVLEFVKVVASANVTPILSVPGFPNTVNLSSTSIMEVEE
jgi:Flp pilus assembly protein TadG